MTPNYPMLRLVGTWTGTGHGEYPTLPDFSYAEVLVFSINPDDDSLHYVQNTWKDTPSGRVGSHQESGFVHWTEDGTVTWHNVQIGGRLESLTGRAILENDRLTLRLASQILANDERMIATTRVLTLDDDILHYVMDMATTTSGAADNTALYRHLEATLQREK